MRDIFVFGSNLTGLHGAGAAREAVINHGAIMWLPTGLQGNSYAIPTKDKDVMNTLPLSTINIYVLGFINFAKKHPKLKFKVTQIGCGLAGLKAKDIAPMFIDAPDNCYFDTAWTEYLGDKKHYWGTYA